jgi:hypothetical protein
MNNNMDVFQVIYNTEEDGELYAISIVDEPANGFNFIAMKGQKEVIKLQADKQKQILYGIVLRPDQKIYREFEDGTPFFLTFDAPTIERFSQDFIRKGYQLNSTYNHNDDLWLDDSTVVEQWIVQDPSNDKLNAIGFSDLQAGDWAIGMKLSDKSWNEYVLSGKAKGFSIDSFIQFEKLNFNKTQTTMKKTSFLQKLVNLFAEGNVSLATVTSDLGELTADAFEVGNIVYDANMQPLMDAEFVVGNLKYSTDLTGMIDEISDLVEETADETTPAVPTGMSDIAPEDAAALQAAADAIAAEAAKQLEDVDIQALKDQIAALTAEVEKLTTAQADVLNANQTMEAELKALKEKEVSTKLKATGKSPIVLNKTEKTTESASAAISRILTKSNNQ